MAITYIGDSNPDGVQIGIESTDKIGLYGATPVAQAATIADQTSAVTTSGFNALLTACKNIGIVASA